MTEETHDAARPRPARHRHVDRGLADRRLGAADRRHVRDPELRTTRTAPAPPGAAGADLHRRDRAAPAASCCCSSCIGAQLFCGMSSVTANSRMIYAFSRDGALPGSRVLAPGQQADQDADQRDLAGRRRRVHPGPAVPVERDRLRRGHLDRGHRPVHRLRHADVPAAAPGRELQARARGTWAGGAALIGWIAVVWVVFIFDPVHAAARSSPITRRQLQLHVVAVLVGARLRRHLLAGLGAGTGSRARRSRARPRSWPRSSGSSRLHGDPDRRATASAARPADPRAAARRGR